MKKICNRQDVGKVVREVREGKSITQSQISRNTGISRMTLNDIENGKRNCSLDTLFSVIEQVGIEMQLIDKQNKP